MKRAILVIAVLVVLALFAVPALAAPPQHKVTYGGWGVTEDFMGYPFAFIGDTVHFAGQAQQAADGTWTGEGTFMDTNGTRLKAHLNVTSGMLFEDTAGTYVGLMGDADVTVDNVKIGTYPFIQILGPTSFGPQTYLLGIFIDDPQSSPQVWFISGDGNINGGPIKIT
ncbi:hypothetical protein [Methanosphaerula subterraneus]|uniref:hypothetical protein n=1 Tax=Methanosphaerula subterraneus TaxID=3350244 RepID=UPI003F82F653